MIIPRQVSVELTNACNGKCTMCPNRLKTRPVTHIDVDLYTKIIADVRHLGIFTREQSLGLCGVGEPLLHPDFEMMVRLTYAMGVPYGVGTNGSLFDRYTDLLLACPPEELCFSIDGTSQAAYETLRPGLSLAHVIKCAQDYLVALRTSLHIPFKTWIQMVVTKDNVHEVNDFIRAWLPYTEPVGARVFLKCVCPWPKYPVNTLYPSPVPAVDPELVGKIVMAGFDPPITFRTSCGLFEGYLGILSDGSYVPCCSPTMDYWGLGNAADMNIEQVFNSEAYNKLRATPKEEIPFCAECT